MKDVRSLLGDDGSEAGNREPIELGWEHIESAPVKIVDVKERKDTV